MNVVPRWAVRLASLAGCAAAFWLVAWLTFGAVVAHWGIELWNFWGALVLLGIGWNFGFIGATAIVASSYRPAEADKVQGFHDIILFSTVALSSFSSGKVFTAFGWSVMNLIIWPVTAVAGWLLEDR